MIVTSVAMCPKHEVVDIVKLQTILTVKNPEYANFFKYKDHRYVRKEDIPDEDVCFLETTKSGYIFPRNVPEALISPVHIEDIRSEGKGTIGDFTFKGSLRAYQSVFLSDIPYFDLTDFLLEVPCGHGKSVLGLWLTSQYKVRTIVLVPTLFLAEQWLKEAHEFIPLARTKIYEVGSGYRSADILIINLDRVNAADFDEGFWNHFGFCISDEAHRNGAYTYYPIVNRLNSRRRVGLTATFRRTDQMHMILKYVFGRVFTMESQHEPAQVIPFKTGITFNEKDYLQRVNYRRVEKMTQLGVFTKVLITKGGSKNKIPGVVRKGLKAMITFGDGEPVKFRIDDYDTITSYNERTNFSRLDTLIAEHQFRNKIVVALIKKLRRSGRVILFLSKRRAMLEKLYQVFTDQGYKTVLVVGGKKKPEEQLRIMAQVKKADIVFGIDKLAKEGLDAPRVDTLVLHHPLKDVEQAKGRIERFFPGKQSPLFFYLLDDNDICFNLFRASHRYLKGSKIAKAVNWNTYFQKYM